MSEQRRFPRISFVDPVQYEQPDTGRVGGCTAYDLSEGGIRLRCEDFFPLEQDVRVNIVLEKGRVLSLSGCVVWIQKIPHAESYQVGIEFESGSPNQAGRADVKRYVEQRVSGAA